MRILVLRPGAIGDSLLAFPLLRALRTHIIDAHITFVSNPSTLQLALDNGMADEVSDYGDPLWSQLFLESSRDRGGEVEGRERLHQCLQDIECAICWLTDIDGIVERNLQAEGVKQIIVAPGRPP